MAKLDESLVVAWSTDCHLNFVDEQGRAAFYQSCAALAPDVLLLGGDMGHGPSTHTYLRELASALSCPIYLVLGNHDYYGCSIPAQREAVRALCEEVETLHWLPDTGPVALTPEVGLVGHGGWGDGRLGDYDKSTIMLNDYVQIKELCWLSKSDRLARLHALGDEAAATLQPHVEGALARFEHVFCLMHVPPFLEACVYEGKPSDDNWAPHFSCKAVGDMLYAQMEAHPKKQMTLLCGHTHGEGHCHILPHLEAWTGEATYGAPAVQRVFRLPLREKTGS